MHSSSPPTATMLRWQTARFFPRDSTVAMATSFSRPAVTFTGARTRQANGEPDAYMACISEPQQDLRTSPSAGATFPLEVALLVTGAPEPADGIYRYHPQEYRLELRATGDRRGPLHDAALGRPSTGEAPVVMVISGVVSRTARCYGTRAKRYVHMETGHAAQNV